MCRGKNNRTINCTLEIAYNASVTFNVTEDANTKIIYYHLGDETIGTDIDRSDFYDMYSQLPSISTQLNNKIVNCNAGDVIEVSAISAGHAVVLYLNDNDSYDEYGEDGYAKTYYTVVEGSQIVTIHADLTNSPT